MRNATCKFKMAKCCVLNLVKKPNTRSSVWTYFGLEADESDKPLRDKDSPVCRACKKSVLAKGGNTSNRIICVYVGLAFQASVLLVQQDT